MATPEFERGGIVNALIDLPVRLLFASFAVLPHRGALAIAGWISARVLAPVFGINRRIRANLGLIHPDMPDSEVKSMCRQVSDNAGRLMVESFNTAGFIRHAERAGFCGAGKEALLAALAAHRPVVLVSGHFGNYQVLRVLLARRGYQTAAIYRPMNNAYTNRRYIDNMNWIAGPNFARGMPGTKALLGHLRNGGAIALLNDQFAHEGTELRFMGQPAFTMTSAAGFALKYHAMLVPYYGIRAENGIDFNVVIEPEIQKASARDMTQALNDSLQAMVTRHPGQWFWIHKRWKRPD